MPCTLLSSLVLAFAVSHGEALTFGTIATQADTMANVTILENPNANPVTVVVELMQKMKETCEKDFEADTDVYEKMQCWCEMNSKEKTEAIDKANKDIALLKAAIEEGTGLAATLNAEIADLKASINEIEESLTTAITIRDRDAQEWADSNNDMTESAFLLNEAIKILRQVQLVQRKSQSPQHAVAPDAVGVPEEEALVQVRRLLSKTTGPAMRSRRYRNAMQRDLWDLLGSLPHKGNDRVLTGLTQSNQPTGLAAGVKSYNSRSGQILGILEVMLERIEKEAAAALEAENAAKENFNKLKEAKEAELEAAKTSMTEKLELLATTNKKLILDKEALVATESQLASDEQFLAELKASCKKADEEYESRSKTRQDEILAIAEAIKILMDDDARSLFNKATVNTAFVQVGSRTKVGTKEMRSRAALKLLKVANRFQGTSSSWQMAQLAVSMKIDGFVAVKAELDKMVVFLKAQQSEEVVMHDKCTQDLHQNEMDTLETNAIKKDLNAKLADTEALLSKLNEDISDLESSISTTNTELKKAGEDRKQENADYKETVADQRQVVYIVKKALNRLAEFYDKESLISIKAKAKQDQPAAGKEFKSSTAAPGVMTMLQKVIQDADAADKAAVASEQSAVQAYAEYVANANTMLKKYSKTLTEKTIAKNNALSTKEQLTTDIAARDTELGNLGDLNTALHEKCDFLLKNYDVRQQARAAEIEAIGEAKAILSGADFS